MKNASFIKGFLGRGQMVAGLVMMGLLVLGVSQAQAQGSSNPGIDVTNLFCGINEANADFDVVALSSTDSCVSINVSPQNDCATAVQFILSRGYLIDAGGGGAAQGISEALVTTAGGIMYTFTRRPGPSKKKQFTDCPAT